MSDVMIKVQGLSKKYRLRHQSRAPYQTVREALARKCSALWRPSQTNNVVEDFWALRDVSFEVKRGECVGIIGRNGAGKSTLLKILSRITEPTTGRIALHGRVASLLEVGTGFHQELTGRENIYLNGTILGMTKREIDRKFDEIVAFSEIEKFLDTPVKRYSSGMYVRLAFAVAAHLEPEILIVDEVLAVGDAQFQKKCLGKMGDVAKGGRTVIFVSHNMAAVNVLCMKSFLLNKGKIVLEGKTEDVIGAYLKQGESNAKESGKIECFEDAGAPVQIKYLAIKNEKGEINRNIAYEEAFSLELGFMIRKPSLDYYAAISIYDSCGQHVVFTADDDIVESRLAGREKGEYVYEVRYQSKLLKPGEYFVAASLADERIGRIDTQDARISFQIRDQSSRRGMRGRYRQAVVAPEIYWELRDSDGIK